jgi:hypothetical protein
VAAREKSKRWGSKSCLTSTSSVAAKCGLLTFGEVVEMGTDGTRVSRVAALQGGYFLATGIWPLLSRRTFERITGPKTDFWLAQTVGVLVGSIGGTLVLAHRAPTSRATKPHTEPHEPHTTRRYTPLRDDTKAVGDTALPAGEWP